jgi:hypothetical protein
MNFTQADRAPFTGFLFRNENTESVLDFHHATSRLFIDADIDDVLSLLYWIIHFQQITQRNRSPKNEGLQACRGAVIT